MENLKIRVTTEQESKEAQELFFELGGDFYFGGKLHCNTHLELVTINKDGLMANIELDGFNYTEITLPQLRDMVVLKRNDPKDATHKCLWDVNPEYYTDSKGSVYFYKKELDASCWVKTVNSKDWCDKNLKLIKDEAMKESLNDKIATAEVAQRELKGVDNVNHPQHYTSDPSGIECIEITRHRNFNIGNAIKYLWRNGLKDSDSQIQDLEKAIWYIQDEINRLSK